MANVDVSKLPPAVTRARAGTPTKFARAIRQTVERPRANELPRYDWVIAHVWSWFKPAPGSDENAEDMPQENAAAQGGVRGYTPATWCAARLPKEKRAALIRGNPDVFSVTDHYRNYPAVLLNLLAVNRELLGRMIEGAWRLQASRKQVAAYDGEEGGS